MDSGLAISYKQWAGLKDAVHTSMHWAAPNLAGRMLGVPSVVEEGEALSLRTSPETERKVKEESKEAGAEKGKPTVVGSLVIDPEDTVYEATPLSDLHFRVETPPPEWEQKAKNKEPEKPKPTAVNKVDEQVAKRRQQFAQRRDSSIGAMMMVNQMEDTEIRRRFRNYEI